MGFRRQALHNGKYLLTDAIWVAMSTIAIVCAAFVETPIALAGFCIGMTNDTYPRWAGWKATRFFRNKSDQILSRMHPE